MLVTALQTFRKMDPAKQRVMALQRELDELAPPTPGPRSVFTGRSDYRKRR
jgi:hypothetical protein